MKCYNCGCDLSEHDFCTSCGADVSQYKKVMYISNRFYNDGLESAKVRDLSGAVNSLRQCLKFNKNNIEARNLLGLVYFETGEVVAALSEWVISQNIRPKKNVANDYIEMIQSNPSRLETINQTIKKYNQALSYSKSDSPDLAIIQLKQVLALNEKFIRARQLLALLYISEEKWDEAKAQLIKCANIDTGNTTTMRYRMEVDEMLTPVEGTKSKRIKVKKEDEIVRFKSGNEDIIQPAASKSNSGFGIILNLFLGVCIGIASAWFIIMPARVNIASQEAEIKIKAANEQLDLESAENEDLKSQLESTKTQLADMQEELASYEGYDGSMGSAYALIQATDVYLSDPENIESVADYLDEVDITKLGEDSQEAPVRLYNTLLALAGPELAQKFYDVGYEAYSSGDYEVAIENLSRAYQYDSTNGEALYYLAQSYNHSGDETHAVQMYRKVIDEFPDTEKAMKSQGYLEQLTGSSE
ncbi:MAG: tetratricopeptide repeat protein [Lachnospiraceae bacterium]|nr:tetratricopeptide repeat protein [Lachnospiraceae bacterium]